MNYKDVNDYEMLYLIAEKDETAERILFDKYRNLIVKLARKYLPRVTHRGAEMDDLIQEGYIGLYSAVRNYRIENQNLFYTFAYVCIERQISTYCRRLSTAKQEVLNFSHSLDVSMADNMDSVIHIIASDEEEPHQKMVFADCILEIQKFKNSLSDEMDAIFDLHINGFTYQEIATLLDISKRDVDCALRSVRTKLKHTDIKRQLLQI